MQNFPDSLIEEELDELQNSILVCPDRPKEVSNLAYSLFFTRFLLTLIQTKCLYYKRITKRLYYSLGVDSQERKIVNLIF